VPDPTAYVFGYASLVALEDADAVPGRLRGYRRCWGVAMNNWEGGEDAKHWLDRESGKRPHVRVAYLDLREEEGSAVNGLALPVDRDRLADLDAREINYRRIEVSEAFEPIGPRAEAALTPRVFTYVGLDAARERCRKGAVEGNVFVAGDYVSSVRRAFEGLAHDALPEFDRTTDPLPFPERDVRVVLPRRLDS
jgi:cation transport regulator ChaC